MRINRAKCEKDKKKQEKLFNNYKENYQREKEKYISNKLSEQDFVEWIKKQKEGNNNGNTRANQK